MLAARIVIVALNSMATLKRVSLTFASMSRSEAWDKKDFSVLSWGGLSVLSFLYFHSNIRLK